ncbi:hypothetical protein NT6N_32340 [Oceaniferula spumae]|uniref:Uncharacterized protein n=1 Tax=Oceaniferula spumae TaxID=2979115 RepID=A0AAT9FQM5_9BACT
MKHQTPFMLTCMLILCVALGSQSWAEPDIGPAEQQDTAGKEVEAVAVNPDGGPLLVASWESDDLAAVDHPLVEAIFVKKGGVFVKEMQRASLDAADYKLSPTQEGIMVMRKQVDVEGIMSYKEACKFTFEEGVTRVFVYLLQKKGKLTAVAVDLAERSFPLGTFQFVNTTDKAVHVSVNDETMKVEAGHRGVVRYQLSDSGTMRVVASNTDDPSKKLAVMTIGGRAGQRMLGLFHTTRGDQNHRILIERGIDRQGRVINR